MPSTCDTSLTNYVPKSVAARCVGVRTPLDAFRQHSPSLFTLSRANSTDGVTALVKAYLVSLDALIDAKNGLSKPEIDLLSEEINAKWGTLLTADDLHVITRRIALGYYGEIYERLSAAKVMRWVDDYCDERMDAVYADNLRRDRNQLGRDPLNTQQMRGLGYEADQDGRLHVDSRLVDEANERAEQRERERRQRERNESDYQAWRKRYEETKKAEQVQARGADV